MMTTVPTDPVARVPTTRDLAIQAATMAKLNSFATAYSPNPAQATRIEASFAKTCPPLAKFANLCDSGLVKQLFFVLPNFKLAIISCPFVATDTNGTEVIAGNLGDAMDVTYPVTIRMKDARSDIISVAPSRVNAERFKLPISTSNPLDEEGPQTDGVEMPEEPGPDRIKVDITDPARQPCFIAIPKVFYFTPGYSFPTSPPVSVSNTAKLPNVDQDSILQTWFETIRYGCVNLDNYSIHSRDSLFVYEGIVKNEFVGPNRDLASRCTVAPTILAFEDALFTQVVDKLREGKEHAFVTYGTTLLADPAHRASVRPPSPPPIPLPPNAGSDRTEAMLNGIAKAFTESTNKYQTSADREREKDADDVSRFYSLLFASTIEVIQDDGTTITSILPATLNASFKPVLYATKNSKATRLMKEAVDAVAAELSQQDGKFASASTLNARFFDQPLVAALRTGTWENKITVLNPEGVKTNFGLYHVASPKTNSTIYKSRQEGEALLIQQELVEEDKSRIGAKITDLYFQGRMGNLSEINDMIANFFALMNAIIEYDAKHPPLIWQELVKFDKVLRTDEGRLWCELHRHQKEVMFNLVQDLQSTLAGFVNEARKAGYKNLISTGTTISALIFQKAQMQADHILTNFTNIALSGTAGAYKESNLLYKVFNPESDRRRQRDSNDTSTSTNTGPATTRQRTGGGDRSNRPNNVTPPSSQGSTNQPFTPGPPGKKVFCYEGSSPPGRLPHPGAIFPHASRPEQFTLMCCRSAYKHRECGMPTCTFYHFPEQLSTIPRELKTKLTDWITTQPNVKWHGDAIQWSTSGVSSSTNSSAPRSSTQR